MSDLVKPRTTATSCHPWITKLVTGIVLANCCIYALVGIYLFTSWHEREKLAETTAQNLAVVLDHDITGSFAKADLAIRSVEDEAVRNLAAGAINQHLLDTTIARQMARVLELYSLRMSDARGDLLYGARNERETRINVADREYFRKALNTPDAGLIITSPALGRVTGKWVINLVRRVNRPDGSFGGVVIGSLSVEYLTRLFSGINVGPHGVVLLRDNDFSLVARYPEAKASNGGIGTRSTMKEYLEVMHSGKSSVTFTGTSSLDSTTRVYALRRLPGLPYNVMAGLATRDYRIAWYREAVTFAGLTLLFTIVTIIYSRLLAQKWQRAVEIKAELEQQVKERTAAVHSSNEQLQVELVERKQIEEQLRESEERLEAVLEGSQLGFWDWDIEKGSVHRNQRWAEMLGYTLEEIEFTVRQWTDLIHPDDREPALQSLNDHLDGKTCQHVVEYRMRTKSGSYKWILDRATVILRNPQGAPLRMSGTHTDVTERKRIDEVLLFLAQTTTVPVNEAFFCHLASYLATSLEMEFVCIDVLEEGNLSARTLAMFVDGVFEDNVSYTLADTPCGEVVANRVCCYRDGVRHHFLKDQVLQDMLAESYVGTILWSGDRPIGLIAVIGRRPLADPEVAQKILQMVGVRAAAELEKMMADTALKKTLAELARSNEELERFAYVASHDLQEPLRMVMSYTELLERRYGEQLDESAKEFIGYAADGARRMHQMINDLLAYSRVGTQGRPAEQVDAGSCCTQALSNLKLVVEQTGAEITVAPLPTLTADSSQLVQLFQNLFANALKFHGEAIPRVTVRAEELAKEWRFAVADNGIGLDPAQSDRIFQIFQRLHGYSKYPGTGIGLAVCKRIVERHGGRIWVESTPGAGATFFFTIPKTLQEEMTGEQR